MKNVVCFFLSLFLTASFAHAQTHNGSTDALLMMLQETQSRLEATTAEIETMRFEFEKLKKELEKINADTSLRLKEVEEKLSQTTTRTAAVEEVIFKAQEEQKKAEQQRIQEEKLEKQKKAAAEKAEKERKEKLKASYGAKKPQALYDEALALLNKKNYQKSQEAFKAFLELHPKNGLAGNAQYWLGESYYAQGKYDLAAIAFADGYKNYQTGTKAPDLLFKLGMTLSRLKKKNEACVAFDSFEKQYPKVSGAMKKQLAAETKKLSCK